MAPTLNSSQRHPGLAFLRFVLKLFYHRHAMIGTEHIQQDAPAVYVCNHLDTYAPIILMLYFPYPFRPWVHANMTSPDLCRDFLEVDFVQKTLKLKPPVSRWVAALLAPLSLGVMKAVNAIPVYSGKMRIRDTLSISIETLKQGGNLVIFPESKTKRFSEFLNDFHVGFVHLARRYFKSTGDYLRFYPVYVNPNNKTISIGHPTVYSAGGDFHRERQRIVAYLRDTINRMAAGQE